MVTIRQNEKAGNFFLVSDCIPLCENKNYMREQADRINEHRARQFAAVGRIHIKNNSIAFLIKIRTISKR